MGKLLEEATEVRGKKIKGPFCKEETIFEGEELQFERQIAKEA